RLQPCLANLDGGGVGMPAPFARFEQLAPRLEQIGDLAPLPREGHPPPYVGEDAVRLGRRVVETSSGQAVAVDCLHGALPCAPFWNCSRTQARNSRIIIRSPAAAWSARNRIRSPGRSPGNVTLSPTSS